MVIEYNITDIDYTQRKYYFDKLAKINLEKINRSSSFQKKETDFFDIRKLIKSRKTLDWCDGNTYEQQVKELQITNIVNTPLMLSIISQSLPDLLFENQNQNKIQNDTEAEEKEVIKATRAKLYQVFTEEHIK